MLKIFAKKFVTTSKTEQIVRMSPYEKKIFLNAIFSKIPNISKEELISLVNSPAKVENFIKDWCKK